MRRRDFVGAVAGVALERRAGARRERRVRIGVLGAAHSHALDKIRVLLASPDFDLVGVWPESDAVRGMCASLGVHLLGRDELLAASEAVAVESAVRDHAEHACVALRAGRHVHLEKPPAVTLAAFDQIARLARRAGRVLQVGYMWRHHPGVEAALQAARAGWLGEIRAVRVHIGTALPEERRSEWAEFRGGVLFELGCHLIDPIVRLLGAPQAVHATLGRHGLPRDTLADETVAVLEYPRTLAVVTASATERSAAPSRRFEVRGTLGSAVVCPIEPPVLRMDLARAAGPYTAGAHEVPLPPYRRYVEDFAELAACVREGRPSPIPLDVERVVQRTLLAACGMR